MRSIGKRTFWVVLFAVFSLIVFLVPSRQAGPPQANEQETSEERSDHPGGVSPCTTASQARVVGVRDFEDDTTKNAAGLGEDILVTVDCLEPFLKVMDKKHPPTLFLNNIPVSSLEQGARTSNALQFHLRWTNDSKTAWTALLGNPQKLTKPVSVSIGPQDGAPLPTTVDRDKFKLIVVSGKRLVWWIGFMIFSIASFLSLARKSAIIRNFGPGSPYSLALTQMAFWSLVVVSAYIFLWLITGSTDTLNGSTLALLGIGIGTALGSRIIDANKQSSQLQALTAKVQELNGQLVNADAGRAQELTGSLTDVRSRIDAVKNAHAVPSRNFINDILSDRDGVSFHRFQMVVWTLVLGVIFCASVYRELAMPEFSETMLALVGISSGTYLGFKFPEQKN